MSKRKHRDGTIKQNGNKNKKPESFLFSEADAKSMEVSDYILGHGAFQINKSMHEPSMPTGVVGIDESVVLPTPSLESYHQYDPKSDTKTIRSNQKHERERVHLPPINHQHYPYEYFYAQPNYHHSGHLYHIHPIHHTHQSFQQHHHPRPRPRPLHRHHKHRETYDPRWWYMPLNSVHGPKSRRPINHHYTPPKWYELPSRQ